MHFLNPKAFTIFHLMAKVSWAQPQASHPLDQALIHRALQWRWAETTTELQKRGRSYLPGFGRS